MPDISSAVRRVGVLDRAIAAAKCDAVEIRVLEPQARFVLRVSSDDANRIGQLAGFDLRVPINKSSQAPVGTAARLGPDEWLILIPTAEADGLRSQLAVALAGAHHSLIDISHRNVGIELRGSAAEQVISSGCTLDLGRFPPGSATRTLLGKVEIVLISQSESGDPSPVYRLECWRSFGRYLHAFLAEAAIEYGNS